MLSASPAPDSPWHAHPREIELVRRCASAHITAAQTDRVRALLAHDLDWAVVQAQARRHGVEAMVHHRLHEEARVPPDVHDALAISSRATAHFNMHRLHVLLALLQRCDDAGCRVVSFKGAVLAQRFYGNLAFRRFADLDLLVAPADVPRVKAILEDMDFVPLRTATAEADVLEAQMGVEMRRAADQVMVELHTALLNKTLAYHLDAADVLQRATRTVVGGQAIYTMAPHDLLLYLCAHGTKHHWARLKWVADVAHVLRGHSGLDAQALCCHARRMHCERVLLLGLHLAQRWLDAPLDPVFEASIKADAVVEELARFIETRWLCTDDGLDRTIRWQQVRFFARTRRRWRDAWPMWAEYARRSLQPSDQDRAFVDLPRPLHPLYALVRPVRIWRDWRQGLLHGASETASSSTRSGPVSA